MAKIPYSFAIDLAVPCPFAAGISAFLHFLVLASIPSLEEIGGLLNAAPTGFEVSPKSNKNFALPGSINLGNFVSRGKRY